MKYIFAILFMLIFNDLGFSQTLFFSYDENGNRKTKIFQPLLVSKPSLIFNNNSLVSSASIGNFWFINDTIISGAINQSYLINRRGRYSVQVSLGSGCTSPMSDYFTTGLYTFTGDGSWAIDSNWRFKYAPPHILPAADTIVIDPIAGGKSVLWGPLTLTPGSNLIVQPGKQLEIKED